MVMRITAEKSEQRTATEVAATAIGRRFKRFGPESEKAVGKADVKEDEISRQLREAWKRIWRDVDVIYGTEKDTHYEAILVEISGIDYSSGDVITRETSPSAWDS
jgi:hypothetical protein